MAACNKTSTARARKLKHQAQALDLRRAGHSYAAISGKLGISKSSAHQLVQESLEDARRQIAASADELRSEEIARLDGMLAKLYPKAARGDVAAVDRVLRIGERRAKLLGLEAPVRIETSGVDGNPIEIASASIDPSKLSTEVLRALLDARVNPQGG
jgi:DNA-directed RNA polymerase subunit K/omega